MTQRLILASNNAGKLKEFQQILGPIGFTLHPQGEFECPGSRGAARDLCRKRTGKGAPRRAPDRLPALADDSGVCVNALGGAPGVYSARFAGEPKSDARNNEKLVADLADKAINRPITTACWSTCAMPTTRSRSSPTAAGTERSSTRRAARTVLATTRYFLIPSAGQDHGRADAGGKERAIAPWPGPARTGRETEMIPIKVAGAQVGANAGEPRNLPPQPCNTCSRAR
jgi:inosine/xanthosine triphosphate pyrophosphatase family protein